MFVAAPAQYVIAGCQSPGSQNPPQSIPAEAADASHHKMDGSAGIRQYSSCLPVALTIADTTRRFVTRFGQSAPSCRSVTPLRHAVRSVRFVTPLRHAASSRRSVTPLRPAVRSVRSVTPLRHAVRPGRSIMALAHAASSDNVQQLLCTNRSLTMHELAPTMHTCKELQQQPVKELRSVYILQPTLPTSYCHRPMYMTVNITIAQHLTSLKRNVERHVT